MPPGDEMLKDAMARMRPEERHILASISVLADTLGTSAMGGDTAFLAGFHIGLLLQRHHPAEGARIARVIERISSEVPETMETGIRLMAKIVAGLVVEAPVDG